MKTHGHVKDSYKNYFIVDGIHYFYSSDRNWDPMMHSPWYPGKRSVGYWKWKGRINRWGKAVMCIALWYVWAMILKGV